jgi:hypothetical protein
MTNPLDILKSQLTDFLDKSDQGEDFNDAVEDGIYACNLNSVKALEQWINPWVSIVEEDYAPDDKARDYLNGVAFVEDQWNKITGMF